MKKTLMIMIGLVATSMFAGTASAAIVFFDDFQDETLPNLVPGISAVTGTKGDVADIGTGYNDETFDYHIEVLADPTTGAAADSQVLRLKGAGDDSAGKYYAENGSIDGALTGNILLDGAVFTFDFYQTGGTNSHAIQIKPRLSGTSDTDFGTIGFNEAGGISGGGTYNSTNANGRDAWYRATITFTYDSTDQYDVDVDVLDIANNTSSLNNAATVTAPAGTQIDEIYLLGNGNADKIAYVDNVTVSGVPVPEPATMSLLALGGLAMLRRRRRA
jgi:hypothetical protein